MDSIVRAEEAASQCDRLVEAFAGDPAGIANLSTKLFALAAGGTVVPTSVNDAKDAPTCYLCCASAAYIDYASEELRNFEGSSATKLAMQLLLKAAAPVVKATRFDHQVQPNNWLFSTNIWCGLSRAAIEATTVELLEKWPGRAIVWRSLNELTDRYVIASFRAAGYQMYPARQVYIFDCRRRQPPIHRDERRDMTLLARADYEVVPPEGMRGDDFGRIEALYGKLYLEKYTPLNPQYTARLLERLHAAGVLRFFGLRRHSGRLDGVVGFFEQSEVVTAPVVGYDTAIGQETGLYRRLMAIGLSRARERRLLFNMSAGAAGFKRNRGALPAIEYAAVYNRHLPWKSRAAAAIVRTILERVGVPIMRKFKL
jgi:hypothetical protein